MMGVEAKLAAVRHVAPARWTRALPVIVLLVLVAMVPLMVLGSPDGHDFEYHVNGWIETVQQWRAGVWLPRWASLAAYGYGDPRFTFYPPVSRLLGAAALLLLPANAAVGGLVLVVLVMAGMAMFALARPFLPPKHAIAAAAFYAVNPYILLCVYQRSAYGELLTNALCPLLLLCAVRLSAGTKAIAPLSLVFALFWLSDLPAAVVVTYALTLIIVILAVIHRDLALLLRGALAMVLGFALGAFFILPAAYEQRWVNITVAISPDFRPETWEYTWTFDAEAQWFYVMISSLVYGTGVLSVLAGLLSWRERRRGWALWWVCVLLTVASIIMMLPDVSGLIYTHLPKLEFVQFPFRWLLVLSGCMTILMAMALGRFRARWLGFTLAVLALPGAFAIGWSAPWHPRAVTDYQEKIRQESGYEADGAFMPPHVAADAIYAARNLPGVQVAAANASVQVSRWTPDHKAIQVQSPIPTQLAFHLLNYPGWSATVNGKAVASSSDSLGRLVVAMPAGNSRVDLRFTRTADHLLGMAISFLALLILGWLRLRFSAMKA